LGKGFKVRAVMREQCLVLADRISQLLGIVFARLSRILRCARCKASRLYQTGHQHIDVLVQIEIDE
jgi:hypothetical protein